MDFNWWEFVVAILASVVSYVGGHSVGSNKKKD